MVKFHTNDPDSAPYATVSKVLQPEELMRWVLLL